MVDNQHRKITGYRDLTEEEIAAMNKIKETEALVLQLHSQIAAIPDTNGRSLAIAKTELQTAFMWLARAVARPNGE